MTQNNTWYKESIPSILQFFGTSERGLDEAEASRRLKKYGPNKLAEQATESLLAIFLRQFQSPLIYVLILASAIVFYLGETADGVIILIVLLFNSLVGTIQEGRAQNTLLALKKFVTTQATVLREEKELILSDIEVVPGDIIVLQEGEKIAADARVLISRGLKVDEAAMTGESNAVHKVADASIEAPTLPAEQKNMVFKGTHVVAGNGKAVVVATGSDTAIGHIAREIATIDTEIPLKTNIRYLSRVVIITVAGICSLLFLIGLIMGNTAAEMFAVSVSLAVSIIPEGLPIVVTLILATGVRRMSKCNALVKKLQAVEALGQARVIAVDKTGTITKNQMVIQKIYTDKKMYEVGGVGYEPKGDFRLHDSSIDPVNEPALVMAGKIAALCSNARVMYSEEEKQWQVAGDPTEAAMLVFAQKVGFHKDELMEEMPIVAEVPFNYKLRYHAVVNGQADKKILAVAGAPEEILNISSSVWHDGKNQPLSNEEKMELEKIFYQMSSEGLRVIAVAEGSNIPERLEPAAVNNLTFIGFLGMKDALRLEIPDAMRQATAAGIRVIMITGDYKITAEAIAREAGIFHDGDEILTGGQIDLMSKNELAEKLGRTTVFARVSPEHKLLIIKAFEARGEIIAMTGDGVNDAPSLVAADLGVAMGKIGTEVAKESADIILLDDNFGSIVLAIEEGRSIYITIKKVILYLFSTSLGEAITITGALLLGYPLPLLAAQIIWLNLVTDGFLDVAIAMEPKEKNLLRSSFEKSKKYLIDKLMVNRMILMALPMAIGTLFVFNNYIAADMTKAWTMSLTLLAAFQWFNAWNCRSENKSIFQTNPFSNKYLVGATIIVVILQLFAVYNPFMQSFLRTTALDWTDWLLIMPIAASIIIVEEIRKMFYREKITI